MSLTFQTLWLSRAVHRASSAAASMDLQLSGSCSSPLLTGAAKDGHTTYFHLWKEAKLQRRGQFSMSAYCFHTDAWKNLSGDIANQKQPLKVLMVHVHLGLNSKVHPLSNHAILSMYFPQQMCNTGLTSQWNQWFIPMVFREMDKKVK